MPLLHRRSSRPPPSSISVPLIPLPPFTLSALSPFTVRCPQFLTISDSCVPFRPQLASFPSLPISTLTDGHHWSSCPQPSSFPLHRALPLLLIELLSPIQSPAALIPQQDNNGRSSLQHHVWQYEVVLFFCYLKFELWFVWIFFSIGVLICEHTMSYNVSNLWFDLAVDWWVVSDFILGLGFFFWISGVGWFCFQFRYEWWRGRQWDEGACHWKPTTNRTKH